MKLEGAHLDLVHRLVDVGIPVMAHVGLAAVGPRDGRLPGAGPWRGRARRAGAGGAAREGRRVLDRARGDAGDPPGDHATLEIPTIGIGAGPDRDAQVLVIHDLLGINDRVPKLSKKYADLRGIATAAVETFIGEVEAGTLPDEEHTYS